MSAWTDWEIVRHHVSICGRVLDTKGHPMPGVQLSALPEGKQPEPQPEAGAGGTRRGQGKVRNETAKETAKAFRHEPALKKTESRPDGTFFFLDCPDGEYMITAVDERSGLQVRKSISVAESAMKKRIKDRGPAEGYRIELVLEQ